MTGCELRTLADFRQRELGSRTAETDGVGAATRTGAPWLNAVPASVTAPHEYMVVPAARLLSSHVSASGRAAVMFQRSRQLACPL